MDPRVPRTPGPDFAKSEACSGTRQCGVLGKKTDPDFAKSEPDLLG
jgi:hypothetical protein